MATPNQPAARIAKTSDLVEKLGDIALANSFVNSALLDTANQQKTADRFSTFMATNADCLVRSCVPGHLTASACVIDPSRNKTLLLLHKKLGRWLQPGGHADGDGNLAHVAWREATEETGIEDLQVLLPAVDLEVHPIPAFGQDPQHLHYDLRFVVLTPPGAQARPNDESNDASWFAPDDPMIVGNSDIERLANRSFNLVQRFRPSDRSSTRGRK